MPRRRAALDAALRPDWTAHLTAASQSTDPLTRRRADWARRVGRRPAIDAGPFRIEVVTPDPLRRGDAETRILVGGRPVVAAAFDKGHTYAPETLLAQGRLRA